MTEHTGDEVLSLRRMIATIQSYRRDVRIAMPKATLEEQMKEDEKATILLERRRLQEITFEAGKSTFSGRLVTYLTGWYWDT